MQRKTSLIGLKKSIPDEVLQNYFQNIEISEVIELYLLPYNSEQTKKAYRTDISAFFKLCKITFLSDLKDFSPIQITQMFFNYLEHFAKREKYRPDNILNPKTINRKAYSVSSFFNHLMSRYNYPFNPTKDFKQLEVARNSTTPSLTKEEVLTIIEHMELLHTNSIKDFRDYLIFIFLASLAVRRNELANLKWSDIDLNSQTIRIFQKGATFKVLPLSPDVLGLLMKYKHSKGFKSNYIFTPTMNNVSQVVDKPLCTDSIFKIVKDRVIKILPNRADVTPHSFRKAFIEISLSDRVDISSIRNATGHHNLDALRYYDGRDKIKNNAVNHFQLRR